MEFTFEIRFDAGVVSGTDSDPQALLTLAEILRHKAAGVLHSPINLDGATRTVSQVRSVEIRAEW